MIRNSALASILSVLALASVASCVDAGDELDSTADLDQDAIAGRAGAVFVMSNDAVANSVTAYRRAVDGSLQLAATYGTTGRGSGDGLGSQGALALGTDGRFLFAVNAGSNELSVFAVRGESLYLVDAIPTGGIRPVSVTEHAGLVYVLHAGDGASSITGFAQRGNGTLAALSNSTRALTAPTVGPAQVQFSPSGRALLVTEKMTDTLDEFRISPSTGRPSTLVPHASSGQTPFGFAVTTRGQVIVSEAFGGAADASAVSSYQLGNLSGVTTVSSSVANTESATCWVALAKNDRFAYVTNTGSGTLSAYRVGYYGQLALVGDGIATTTGPDSKPTDLAVSAGSRFVYVLDSGTHDLAINRIGSDGALTPVGTVPGLPPAAAGLVAQ